MARESKSELICEFFHKLEKLNCMPVALGVSFSQVLENEMLT